METRLDYLTMIAQRFVERSGGLDLVISAAKGIGSLPEEQRVEYVRRIANKSDESAAKLLLAAAFVGFSMAGVIYEATIASDKDAN